MDIASGYTALTAAYQLAKGLKDINDQVKVNEILIDLQAKILEAQEAVRDGRDRLDAIESELKRYQEWDIISAKYQLREFGGQTYAYELKKECSGEHPWHLVCPNCFENRRRSILQYVANYGGRDRFKCTNCEGLINLGKSEKHDEYMTIRSSW